MPVSNHDLHQFRAGIRQLEREIASELSHETECCGVSLAHCHVMMELDNHGPLSISQLCSMLDLDKSTLSRTVDGMTASGLAIHSEDPSNRRKKIITLTEKGKILADSINGQCNAFYKELFSRIPENKRAHIIEAIPLLAEVFHQVRSDKMNDCSCIRPEEKP